LLVELDGCAKVGALERLVVQRGHFGGVLPGPGTLVVAGRRAVGARQLIEALAVALERGGSAVPPFGVEERVGSLTDPLEEILGGFVGRPRDGVLERAVASRGELALHDGGLGEVYPVGLEPLLPGHLGGRDLARELCVGGPVVGQDPFVAADAFVDLDAASAVKHPECVAFGAPGLQALFGGADMFGLAGELSGLHLGGFDLGRERGQQLLQAPAPRGELGVGQVAQRLV